MNRSKKARRRATLLLALLVLGGRPGGGDAGRPKIGTRLPSVLAGASLRNAPVGEPPARDGWVVYAFSPPAPESERNQGRVEELARSLPPGWTLLAVAMDAQAAPVFVERLRVTVPVLTQVPAAALAAYRITRTPRTYVLDGNWKLLEILDGPFEGKVAKKLADRFKAAAAAKTADPPRSGPPGGKALPRGLCRDRQQYPYSRGSKADALGVKLRCGAEGVWVPAA